jgi:hypothetical protein
MASRRTKDFFWLDGKTLRGSSPRAAPVLTMKGRVDRLKVWDSTLES